ncbi:MAG: DEAD/DEAH box helicase [Paludibacteraceae bacterium]
MTFEELGLDEALLRAVGDLGFESPTPIQEAAIPVMLQTDDDLLGLAQTGTGKTAAFGLPLLHHLMQAPFIYEGVRTTRALVLAPTRELCMQISKDLKLYGKYSKLKVVAVYGGEDIRRQLSQLDVTPEIIVATPGRLIDLVRRGKVMLSNIEYLVLDEADEMLNMGFKDDLETILKETPAERRTLLFSATMPKEISAIARNYMRSARELQIGERNAGTENVDHIYYVCKAEHRYDVLKRIVDLNPDIYGIVFCRTKADCQVVSEKLIKDGYNADALHGDLTQVARDNVMQRFRLGAVQLLVATDVAARGLDVHNLTHVINYQLPDDSEVYTHRSGRTGRAGKRGISVSIVYIREVRRINELERLLKRTFKRERIPSGLDVCRKQLFNQIVRLQSVDTAMLDEDTTAAANGLKEAMSMLDYMPKEELIKRFVALEFNRFLAYYKDAVDLNVETKTAKKSTDKSAPGKPSGRGKKVRMKINVGTSDGINTRSFLALVNDTTRDRSITIGDIEVQKNYTFFDLFLDQKQKVVNAFKIYEDLFVVEAKGMKPRENSDSDNYSGKRRKGDNDSYSGRGKGGANGHSDKPWRKGRR